MQPELQRVERLIWDDQLTIEDKLFDRQMTRGLDHLWEVASQGTLATGLQMHVVIIAKQDAAEAIVFGLE